MDDDRPPVLRRIWVLIGPIRPQALDPPRICHWDLRGGGFTAALVAIVHLVQRLEYFISPNGSLRALVRWTLGTTVLLLVVLLPAWLLAWVALAVVILVAQIVWWSVVAVVGVMVLAALISGGRGAGGR